MDNNRQKKALSLKLGQKRLKFSASTTEPASTSAVAKASSAHLHTDPAHKLEDEEEKKEGETSQNPACLSGLCNLGNTCYVNCILQVLRFCPQFSTKVAVLSQAVLSHHCTTDTGANGSHIKAGNKVPCDEWGTGALAVLLHRMWERMNEKERTSANRASVLSSTRPSKFLSKLKEEHEIFDNKMQQDAQEMLRFLLTSLHEVIQSVAKTLPPEVLALSPAANLQHHSSDGDAVSCTRKRKGTAAVSGISRKMMKLSTAGKHRKSNMKLTDFCSVNASKKKKSPTPEVVKTITATVAATGAGKKGRVGHLDFIKELFQGLLVSQTRCWECESFTRRTEPFFDISLPVSNNGGMFPLVDSSNSPLKRTGGEMSDSSSSCSAETHWSASGSGEVGPCSLSWALSQFCLKENLRGENKYWCDHCGHLVEAENSTLFGHLPVIMTLHLNRFATKPVRGLFSGASLAVNKISGNLAFPLALSFSPWCTGDCLGKNEVYQLFAVIFHAGSSCSSGHYTACVRGKECKALSPLRSVASWIESDDDWVHFDDEVVELLSQEELVEKFSPLSVSTAYILFYRINIS